MSAPFWDEYARFQHLVEAGHARDEQLDAMLEDHFDDRRPFHLHDCRRRHKNLDRNLPRRERHRSRLIERHATRLEPTPVEPPPASAVRRETAEAVRRAAGSDWALLRATIDGDYAAVAAAAGVPCGTLKSRVSRLRGKLRPVLRGVA